ncbi:hypothetical protein Glove_689g15 [Diversispora epigaea]|uniref:Protein kinase domain-containing protein n=1 Tax=Diversispora epigaea TaxID=1348612 RepID=A0A397G6Z2_9GLOM|nr:hypothetical protein Glove_689g15 [Diversispora epigaea]
MCILLSEKVLGKCKKCQKVNTGKRWCNTCDSERFQSEFSNWTSEDIEIDEFIQQTQLNATKYEEVIEWIPFDKFNNIEYHAKGGFGKIFKATWSDGHIISWNSGKEIWKRSPHIDVCLKSLNTSTCKSEFLQELIFRGIWAVAMYGITKNPTEKEYMMVMQYAKYALGLDRIHETGLMHKDFHSGNIVNETKISSYITDVGLCKPISQNDKEKIYGVIPYMAPETLNRGEYTQASDIYSFDLMEKCWNTNPLNRPTAKGLKFRLGHFNDNYNNNWIKQQVDKANEANKNFIQYDPKLTHPQAIYTSRHLPFLKPKKVESIICDTKQWDLEIPEDIKHRPNQHQIRTNATKTQPEKVLTTTTNEKKIINNQNKPTTSTRKKSSITQIIQ